MRYMVFTWPQIREFPLSSDFRLIAFVLAVLHVPLVQKVMVFDCEVNQPVFVRQRRHARVKVRLARCFTSVFVSE